MVEVDDGFALPRAVATIKKAKAITALRLIFFMIYGAVSTIRIPEKIKKSRTEESVRDEISRSRAKGYESVCVLFYLTKALENWSTSVDFIA